MHRFFAPALDPGDDIVTLPKDEAEHLTRVLRLGVGDTVSVFDGRGREFLARIVSATRRDVRVQVIARVEPPPEPRVALTVVQAALKADKMDDVVRDAVMLGVTSIRPVVSDANWWHGGSLPGTTTLLVRAANGYCWAAVFNARPEGANKLGGDLDAGLWKAFEEVQSWPDRDLFLR